MDLIPPGPHRVVVVQTNVSDDAKVRLLVDELNNTKGFEARIATSAEWGEFDDAADKIFSIPRRGLDYIHYVRLAEWLAPHIAEESDELPSKHFAVELCISIERDGLNRMKNEIVSIVERETVEMIERRNSGWRAQFEPITPDEIAKFRSFRYWETSREHLESTIRKYAAENVPPAHSPGLIIKEFFNRPDMEGLWDVPEHEDAIMTRWKYAAVRFPLFVHDRCVKQFYEHARGFVRKPPADERFYIDTSIFTTSLVFETELSYAEHELKADPGCIERCRREGEIPRNRDKRDDGTVLIVLNFISEFMGPDFNREWKRDWFVFNNDFSDVVGMGAYAALAAGRARAARDPQKLRHEEEDAMRALENKMKDASMESE